MNEYALEVLVGDRLAVFELPSVSLRSARVSSENSIGPTDGPERVVDKLGPVRKPRAYYVL